MTELLKELEEVVGLAEKLPKGGAVSLAMYGDAQRAQIAAFSFIRTRHAEIAEALRDARRYRWLRISACEIAWNEWCSYSPGYTDDGPEELDSAIDNAMHNSAREAGNEQ